MTHDTYGIRSSTSIEFQIIRMNEPRYMYLHIYIKSPFGSLVDFVVIDKFSFLCHFPRFFFSLFVWLKYILLSIVIIENGNSPSEIVSVICNCLKSNISKDYKKKNFLRWNRQWHQVRCSYSEVLYTLSRRYAYAPRAPQMGRKWQKKKNRMKTFLFRIPVKYEISIFKWLLRFSAIEKKVT